MYIDVFTLCPGVSRPPLSTIVTLLLGWASYCICTSNTCCDEFLYYLVLLMQIHSELRELLSPLLFIDGSLHTNDVGLLCYHVSQKCFSERAKQWIIRTHFLNVRSQERIWEVIVRSISIMYMCLSLVSSIRLSGCWLDVISSNGLRSSSSFRFGDRVLWSLALRLFAFTEYVKKVRTFRSHWACRVSGLISCNWFLNTFATLLCAVCFMFRWWVRWQSSRWWRKVSCPCP